MPAVFVHGVPDTQLVWDAVMSRLNCKDMVMLSLPGFGCPLPAGFSATKEGYVDWLLGQLAALQGPIDLVGHDWGGLLVVRAVSLRPDAVRSWAVGGAPLDREYVWHEAARAWQTPGLGEKVMAGLTPEVLAAALVAAGVSAADAAETAGQVDPTMKQCILSLYRSAVNAGAEWEDDLRPASAPGLVLWGESDPYAGMEFGARLAQRTGGLFRFPRARTGGSLGDLLRWRPSSSATGRGSSPTFSTGGGNRAGRRMDWTARSKGLHYKWA